MVLILFLNCSYREYVVNLDVLKFYLVPLVLRLAFFGIILGLFSNFGDFEPLRSYKIVLIKKSVLLFHGMIVSSHSKLKATLGAETRTDRVKTPDVRYKSKYKTLVCWYNRTATQRIERWALLKLWKKNEN